MYGVLAENIPPTKFEDKVLVAPQRKESKTAHYAGVLMTEHEGQDEADEGKVANGTLIIMGPAGTDL